MLSEMPDSYETAVCVDHCIAGELAMNNKWKEAENIYSAIKEEKRENKSQSENLPPGMWFY